MTEIRPRRSVLYMPGSNTRALEKAKGLPADCLILDLEDSVAPDMKGEALLQVLSAVRQDDFGHRELVIRINGLDTPWGESDLSAAIDAEPDAILVPKIQGPEEVVSLDDRFREASLHSKTKLWIMIETPRSVLHAEAIAVIATQPESRLAVFVMGTNDLAKELRCVQTEDRAALLPSLMQCLLAARAYGLTIIDGVYNDIKNDAGFRQTAEQGNILGFDGKTVVHPGQIEPCNEIFSPTSEAVNEASRIIAAFEEPENRNKGVISFEGRMVELLHVEIARRVVGIAEAITERDANK